MLYIGFINLSLGCYMDTIFFFVFSMLEYLAVFYLSFSLFSIVYKHFVPQLLISSLILTCTSFVMRSLELDIFDVMLQIVIFIFLMRFVFRINTYYAVVVSYGYICAVVIQMISFNVLFHLGLLGKITSFSGGAFIIQSITIGICLCVGELLRAKDWRYSFIPTKLHINVGWNWINLLLLIFVFIEISIIVVSYYYFLYAFSLTHGIFTIVLFIVAGSILYFLEKRELS